MSTLLASIQINGLIDMITSVIGTILYPLFSIIFLLIDGIQDVFYSFAGIGTSQYSQAGNQVNISSGTTGAETDQGIVYYLLNNELVKNMLISIALLALFLIVIFTTLAFIKNIYAAKPKGWKDIVGNAIKGLGNFIILPVCVLLGVWVGNILLQAINGATSIGGSTTMARKLFIASSYNANLFRCTDGFSVTWGDMQWLLEREMLDDETHDDKKFGSKNKTFGEYHGISFDGKKANDPVIPQGLSEEELEKEKAYYANLVDQIFSETKIFLGDTFKVGTFYSLWQVNYIILVAGGIFMLYVLGALSFSMVKRLFYILVLFIISPGVCALYPLDEGAAVKSWTGEVKKQVLSAYGAVAGLNIFFSLLPLIDKISIYETAGFGISDIIQIFILVTGLLVVKDLISLISGFVGGDNAYATGTTLMKQAKDSAIKHTGKTLKVGGAFARHVPGIAKGVWNLGKAGVNTAKDVANRLGQERLHSYARKKGWGEGKGKDFKYLDTIGDTVDDDFIRERIADDKWTPKKAARKAKRQEAIDKFKNSKFGQGVTNFGTEFVEGTKLIGQGLGETAKFIGGGIGKAGKLVGGKIGETGKKIKDSEFGQFVGAAGEAIKDSELTKTVKSESKNAWDGAKDIAKSLYEGSTIQNDINNILKPHKDEQKAWDERHGTKSKKQVVDTGKKLEELINNMGGVGYTSDALRTMGDTIGESFARKLLANSAFANAMGLNKNSTVADIANVDKVLNKLSNFARLISSAQDSKTREAYIEEAKKFAISTDANGNDQLQKALQEAFKAFSADELKIDGSTLDFESKKIQLSDGSHVDLGSDTIIEMNKATAGAFSNAFNEFERHLGKIIEDVIKKNKKKD